jgi:hypothetical protein
MSAEKPWRRPNGNERWRSAGWLAVLLLLPAMGLWLLPWAPTCVVKRFLHIPCPGCGLGHAILSLLHFDAVAAFLYYPPLVLLGVVYILVLTGAISSVAGKRMTWHHGPWGTVVSLGVTATVLGNWAIQLLGQGVMR